MVSDSDLVAQLREILRNSDLETATAGSVRRQLEEDFSVELSDRKGFVRDQIDIFLETLHNENEQEEQGPDSENAKLREEEEEEEEEEKEEESKGERSQKTRQICHLKSKIASKADKQVKKRGGGFQKVCSLSPQLQKVVGESELPRTEVVKKLWLYIRENNLQDPNKRNIICDESLREIFRVNSINMFQMNKALTKHIWPLSAEDENVKHEMKCEDSDDSATVDAQNAEEEEKEEVKEEQDEEEEEAEQEGNARGSKDKRSSKVDKDVKRRVGGFTKLCSLSPQLQALTGKSRLARTDVVKRLWIYIRKKNLKDPNNRRNILCDESLHALFSLKLTRQKMDRKSKQGRERGAYEPKQKEKRQKKEASGFLAPLPLSDALVKFFGTGENTLSRADVVKRMWEYIEQNDLQDPSDKRRILCDDKLKELLEVDSFHGFSILKLLTPLISSRWNSELFFCI
ncbi:hypothetical protein CRYUN_Cryun18bG0102000 [Craigia yunnanensis]